MICQAVETALVRYLIQRGAATHASATSFGLLPAATSVTITPAGLMCQSDDSATFTVNFYSGESEDRISLPAIIVTAQSSQPVEGASNLHTVSVEVTLEVQCDSSTTVNSVAWLGQASRWIHGELSGTAGLMPGLEAAEPSLVITGTTAPQMGRVSEGRRRIHRWEFQVIASLGN